MRQSIGGSLSCRLSTHRAIHFALRQHSAYFSYSAISINSTKVACSIHTRNIVTNFFCAISHFAIKMCNFSWKQIQSQKLMPLHEIRWNELLMGDLSDVQKTEALVHKLYKRDSLRSAFALFRKKINCLNTTKYSKFTSCHEFCCIRYDTIEEFNVDWKEWSA